MRQFRFSNGPIFGLPPDEAYLNTGSYAPVPIPIQEEQQTLRRACANSPMRFLTHTAPELLLRAREELADFLSTEPSRLLLLPNVTIALNLAVLGAELPPGGEILCSDHEYGAMRFLLHRLANERGGRVREVEIPYPPSDPAEILNRFDQAVGSATRILFFSHVTSPTALVFPAQELCRWARERGLWSIVDGAHAPGMVPVAIDQIGADFYGANCHKWLWAPPGAGFLAVHPDRMAGLKPLITSWGADYDPARRDEDSGWGATFWGRQFEYLGTHDRTAQMVLPTLLALRRSLGGELAIRQRSRSLRQALLERMANIGRQPIVSETEDPRREALIGSMTTFAVPLMDPVKARNWMWWFDRISVPFTNRVGRRETFLRVSTAWFNTEADFDRLARAIARMPFADLA